ncbi:MAG: hypothetical protein EXS31_14325 [Pedosphaera sp.]|nr:hypothetical protein [Pedosphaera sp.]
MSSAGDKLRLAREQRKLSVNQVADATKIKTDHIRALEDGNFGAFAAPVYVRGFARTYATLLHLDVPQLVMELDAELSQSGEFHDSSVPLHRKRTFVDTLSYLVSKVNWRIVGPVAAIVVVIWGGISVFRSWQHARSVDPLRNLGPGLYQSHQTNAGELLPLPTPGPIPKG